jgi:hypothetical protein
VKRYVWIAIAMMLAAGQLGAEEIYGEDGSYKGYVEKDGSIYDESGNYKGYIEKDGSVYSDRSEYKGYVEKDGSIYSDSGSYKGEVDGYVKRRKEKHRQKEK